eukprot:CAMPEP_0197881014 /NCGR_PEP_ID=MMETSP1439-20131203/8636_1 /TAXON_ID=66791 /ORGANISM="Gonyaulax spinifera, Strain CCMP409" /LENGTH=290 /DNA_ID=CAMNT_0043500591 /DNA_START=89 /DNA_END=958 /DNA_ORIENTATION=+
MCRRLLSLAVPVLRLAAGNAFDELAFFQANLGRGSMEMLNDPPVDDGASASADAAPAPSTGAMSAPGLPGQPDVSILIDMVHTFNDTMMTLRNDSIVEDLIAGADATAEAFVLKIRDASILAKSIAQKGRTASETEARRLMAEALLSINTSINEMNETVMATSDHLRSYVPEALLPCSLLSPLPGAGLFAEAYNNTLDDLLSSKENPDAVILSEYCARIAPVVTRVANVTRSIKMVIAALSSSKDGKSPENPEFSPLVGIAPDVIEPLKAYTNKVAQGARKVSEEAGVFQ